MKAKQTSISRLYRSVETQCGESRQLGMTMVELLVTISIAAVLATIAAPSMVSTMNDIRQKSAANLIASDLNFARGEAIKRNMRVLICATNAGGTGCETTSPSWLAGWVVCIDSDSDGVCDASSAAMPNPIRARPALNSKLTFGALDTAATPVSVSSIRFNANSTQGAGSLGVNMSLGGTWSGATARVIAVANTGNITSK